MGISISECTIAKPRWCSNLCPIMWSTLEMYNCKHYAGLHYDVSQCIFKPQDFVVRRTFLSLRCITTGLKCGEEDLGGLLVIDVELRRDTRDLLHLVGAPVSMRIALPRSYRACMFPSWRIYAHAYIHGRDLQTNLQISTSHVPPAPHPAEWLVAYSPTTEGQTLSRERDVWR